MTIINGQVYEHLIAFATPAYSYEEGDKQEHYWIDSQNCFYYFLDDEPEDGPAGIMKDGKKDWLIEPVKPEGVKITEENEDLIKWIVSLGPDNSEGKEWDFDNHCPIA